jgi:ankyrin repeat protein
MKHILLTTIAAVVLVGCGKPQEVKDVQLRIAAKLGNVDGVKKAIANGANVNARDNSGTALNHATAVMHSNDGHHEVVRFLISIGADVNTKGTWGKTPLYNAVYWFRMEIFEMLLANGADVKVIVYDGLAYESILDRANNNNLPELADLIRKHGGKTLNELSKIAESSILAAAQTGHIEWVKKHLAAGRNLNAKDEGGRHSIHLATKEGHDEIVKLFLQNGVHVNTRDKDGTTPLDWAIKYKRREIADFLRKHGGKRTNRKSTVNI